MSQTSHRAPEFENVSLGDLLDGAAREYTPLQQRVITEFQQSVRIALACSVLLVIPSDAPDRTAPPPELPAWVDVIIEGF
ncbi:hypothetical protein KDA23_01195 [Candidatus Saccharibacteria bacterium]|nr:hypothetical protein [Candidatus Saccharibacteria bacterium]